MTNDQIKSGCFVGDDSLLYNLFRIDGDDVVKKLMEVFNLSAKVIEKEYGYTVLQMSFKKNLLLPGFFTISTVNFGL